MAYKFIDNKVKNDGAIPATINDYMLYYGGIKSQGQPLLNTSSFIDSTFIENTGDTDITSSDWYNFIILTYGYINSAYPFGKIPNQVNIIDSIIYDKYKDRELLPKITECFEPPFTNYEPSSNMSYDRQALEYIIHGLTYNVLSNNRKKYEKLFTALTAEFNPLWNVDGTETTVRTLERDGWEKTTHDGTDTTTQTNNNTDTTTYDTTEKITRDTTDKLTIDTDNKTNYSNSDTITYNAETEKTTYNNTLQKNGQENTTIETSKSAFNASTQQPTETTHNDLEFTARQDRKTGDDTILKTGGHTDTKSGYDLIENDGTETTEHTGDDTTTHSGDDTTTHTGTIEHETEYDSYTKTDIDTLDTERIEHIRQGNIGVISTVKLLQEYIEFADQLDFFSIVAADIVENVAMLTY